MSRFFLVVVFAVSFTSACGGPGPGPTGGGGAGFAGGLSTGGFTAGGGTSGGGTSGGGTSGGGSSGGGTVTGGGSAGGTTSTSWAIAECEAALDKFVAANCADKQNWVGLKAQCQRIPSPNSAALCVTPLQRAKACHSQFISQAVVACTAFGTTDTNETCGADVLLGVLCAGTVNAGPCAGVQCMYNSDCASGWSCNDQTRRCFQSSARCPGLPCKYNADCPTGFTCNNATGQCNAN